VEGFFMFGEKILIKAIKLKTFNKILKKMNKKVTLNTLTGCLPVQYSSLPISCFNLICLWNNFESEIKLRKNGR